MANEFEDTYGFEWDESVAAIERCYELGWTDGLPVIPPTITRVQEFLSQVDLKPDIVVGSVPERRRTVTVEKLAANAVMAGCLPEYFPVVLTAARAMLHPDFNLIGPSSSLGGAGILVIVNGPVVQKLSINSKNNLFGPGNRANATIGRSIRLILMNTCGAIPGLFDRSILGHPGKYSFCIGESEHTSDWTPLHVERGFSLDESTVTVFACDAPRQARAIENREAIVTTIADVSSTLGSSLSTVGSTGDTSTTVRQGMIAVVVSGKKHVWKEWSKNDLKEAIFSKMVRSMADLKRVGQVKGQLTNEDEISMVSLLANPSDILVVFAGGEENTQCAIMPSWGPQISSTPVTLAIN